MLNLMRKHASSWMIKVILFAIVVVFVFWGVGSMRSQQATQVADVNGEIITLDVYRQTYYRLLDSYRRIYGGQFDDNMLKMLKPNEMALNQLIDKVLLLQEAQRLQIDVGNRELAQSIYSIPVFQVNGAFNKQRYEQVLAQNNITDERFRMDRHEELLIQKLRAVVLSGITATEDEAKEWYNWSDSQVSIEYALFSADRYSDIKPTDEQVKAYFKESKDKYRTDPKVKVRYLYFYPDLYKADVKTTDEDIEVYYNNNLDEYKTEERVKARHILFKVDESADEKISEAQKAEALKVYEKAKASKDFAELAKQHSQGPTKDKGGDLGWFTRDKMVKAFADKAFSMKAGDISEPVRTKFGWHIIKVEQTEQAATRSLKDVTKEIQDKLTADRAKSIALKNAEDLYDSVFDGDDLAKAGKTKQMTIQETDFFTNAGPQDKGIASPRQFAQAAFGLEKMAISEIKEMGDGYYILQVIDREESKIPELDTVLGKVKTDTTKEQTNKRAKADAEAFLAVVQSGKAFAEGSAKYDIKPSQTDFFKRNGPIPNVGNEQQISQEAFELTPEKPIAKKVLRGQKGWYVIRLKERQSPDEGGFGNEKEAIVSRLTEQKRQATYQSWMAELKARSKIDINKKAIQQ